jgi:hypothetical protein
MDHLHGKTRFPCDRDATLRTSSSAMHLLLCHRCCRAARRTRTDSILEIQNGSCYVACLVGYNIQYKLAAVEGFTQETDFERGALQSSMAMRLFKSLRSGRL